MSTKIKKHDSTEKNNAIINYIYESGLLKQYKRTGWWVAGIKDPETVAEHSFRASVIAYILANMEGVNPEKTACMLMFHDIPEARIGDLHKIATRYLDLETAEKNAEKDQLSNLPNKIKESIQSLMKEYSNKESKEAIIAKDADYLECAFQAKEYVDIGYSAAQDMIASIEQKLQTPSAKLLLAELKKSNSKTHVSQLRKTNGKLD